ncbi:MULTISPECIES: Gfo/Idh/MocA family protein [unclassified Bradyrhizobium]|uniref:Gfo/Idh/MocA family protein n=1 Tax=unclassified Bradyrhizobium TaxID=2631580 RepID=UPI001FF24E96|nr:MULTISPECIES: Gfo/Idh/MocA family oxidoreductase [unclassified Bradyrhizobium]MCJ9700067.1 Gfo/Idh/MocA family oxidoreductase [Bradyrhizobium sp. SHOUNA76]MCJ9729083.1 Gfo/Idh/MocA family oxidoreductase [Bradyrhizobium sp. PRIMUS42]
MVDVYSALIVGFGESGRRFLQACRLGSYRNRINVRCIVDIDPGKLVHGSSDGVLRSICLDEVLERHSFDIVFICTSDRTHFDVFRKLHKHAARIKRIVCEKPIAETLDQADIIANQFENMSVAVNFVERYSPVVSRLRHWIRSHDLCMKRALFNWSKQRINDARPTMGIFSELSHPLDLVLYVAGIEVGTDYAVVNAATILSGFTRDRVVVPDSVSMTLNFGDRALVSGSCSYLWSRRDRRVILYFGARNGPIRYVAELRFDEPQWDFDSLEIWSFDAAPGILTPHAAFAVNDTDLPRKELGISKICRLLTCILNELDGGMSDEIARLDQAVYVQKILDDLCEGSGSVHQWPEQYSRGEPAGSTRVGSRDMESAIVDAG